MDNRTIEVERTIMGGARVRFTHYVDMRTSMLSTAKPKQVVRDKFYDGVSQVKFAELGRLAEEAQGDPDALLDAMSQHGW